MIALGSHISFRLENDASLAATDAARRQFARRVLDVARPFGLLAFRWGDTHGHAVVVGEPADTAECARRIQLSVGRGIVVAFQPVRHRPIVDAGHLRSAVLYIFGQPRRHSVHTDPTHDASNLPDVLGARRTGAWTAEPLRCHLPRLVRAEVPAAAGLPEPAAEALDLDLLADAAAAAFALPRLGGRGEDDVAARIAAVHVAAEKRSPWLAARLGTSERTVRRMRGIPADSATVRAVRLQSGLRAIAARVRAADTSWSGPPFDPKK